jgi:tetratricopeptide (TPR) repeat protein
MLRRLMVFLLLLLSACVLCVAQIPTPSAIDLVKQGEKLNSEGKQDDALALYRQALQTSPNLYEAELATGIAFDLKGNYAAARQHLDKAINLASAKDEQQARRAMAISYAFEGKASDSAKFEQQVFDMRVSAQDFTGAAEIADELARIYLESGDTGNAYKWYETGYQTSQKKPNLTSAEKNLWLFRWDNAQARIDVRSGKTAAAQQYVTAAKYALYQANNPDQDRFYPYLTGYVAFYSGDYKTAIADLQKADQRDPFILVLLGEACEKSGDSSQAAEYYRKVLASNAHNPTNAFARPVAKQKLSKGS